jgi:hypothetical protein
LPFDKNVKSINGCIEYSNALFIYANWYECDGEYQGLLVKFPNDAGGDIIMAKSGGILVPYGNNKFASSMFQYPDIHSLKVEYLSLPQD